MGRRMRKSARCSTPVFMPTPSEQGRRPQPGDVIVILWDMKFLLRRGASAEVLKAKEEEGRRKIWVCKAADGRRFSILMEEFNKPPAMRGWLLL